MLGIVDVVDAGDEGVVEFRVFDFRFVQVDERIDVDICLLRRFRLWTFGAIEPVQKLISVCSVIV